MVYQLMVGEEQMNPYMWQARTLQLKYGPY